MRIYDLRNCNDDEYHDELRARECEERLSESRERPVQFSDREARIITGSKDGSYTIQVRDERGNYTFVKVGK